MNLLTKRTILSSFLMLSAASARADANIEFVLDLSGSMRQKLGAETQIASALKALNSALDEIPPDGLVAMRVYGHRVEQTDKEASCRDTELLVPFQRPNKPLIQERLSTFSPKGYTPIAYSLNETRNDLLDISLDKEADRIVVLLTDGEETCGGDAIAVLKKLRDEGFKLKVFTVGFNVNDIARRQLQDIAQFSGGKYFDARDGVALNSALREATKESVAAALISKNKTTYGAAIRGGNSFEDAVALPLDKELKLDHHQKRGDFDYFFVEAKRGEKIWAEIATLEKGLDNLGVTDYPYAGIVIADNRRQQLGERQIIGTPFKRDSFEFVAPADGRYYLLIGTTNSATHKDHVTFTVKKETLGDAGAAQDAGSDPESALSVKPGRYADNHIGTADDLDLFSVEGKKGSRLTVGIIPKKSESEQFQLRVFDEFRQVLYSGFGAPNSGLKSTPIDLPEDGLYYIEMQMNSDSLNDYALVIKLDEGAKPNPAAKHEVEADAEAPTEADAGTDTDGQ